MMKRYVITIFRVLNKLFHSSQPVVNNDIPVQVTIGSKSFDVEFISNTIDVDDKACIRGRCENIEVGDCIVLEFGSANLYYVDEVDYLPNQSEVFTAMITKITSN